MPGAAVPAPLSPEAHRRAERRTLRRVLLFTSPFMLLLWFMLSGVGPFFRNHTPGSNSMAPALPSGSHFLVSRLSYGYSRYSFDWFDLPITGRWPAAMPARGDIVTFRLPRNHETHYVKRVIGLPGDEINVRKGVVFINGKEVRRRRVDDITIRDGDGSLGRVPAFEETLPEGSKFVVLDAEPNGPFDNVGPYKVPTGHLFVMGDNRDNSTDSRAPLGVGYVPIELLIGKVVLTLGGR